MRASIVLFDDFTDIDVWLVWDLFKRVRVPGWEVRLLGEKSVIRSQTGIEVPVHGALSDANHSDVVVFTSGPGTRVKIHDSGFLSQFAHASVRESPNSLDMNLCGISLPVASQSPMTLTS